MSGSGWLGRGGSVGGGWGGLKGIVRLGRGREGWSRMGEDRGGVSDQPSFEPPEGVLDLRRGRPVGSGAMNWSNSTWSVHSSIIARSCARRPYPSSSACTDSESGSGLGAMIGTSPAAFKVGREVILCTRLSFLRFIDSLALGLLYVILGQLACVAHPLADLAEIRPGDGWVNGTRRT